MLLVLADATQYVHLGYNTFQKREILLESYYKKDKGLNSMIEKSKNNNQPLSLFLDSGAFSAFTKGIEIDINQYIQYIKDNSEHLTQYAVLDVIGDAKGTLLNQKHMELNGVNPIPCFHYNEDYEYLKYYVDNYKYIALGGVIQCGGRKQQLKSWLDEIWEKYLINEDGTPKIKVHGFGITSVEIMKRYPWYSVDSTTWVLTGRFGGVLCDIGDYSKITISNKGNTSSADHYQSFSEPEKEHIKEYFANLGRGYTITELANDYKKRDEVNILYFIELERKLSENPTKFIQQQFSLF